MNEPQSENGAQALWVHPAPESSQMWAFMQQVNRDHNLRLKDYKELYQWSIDNVADFWAAVWNFVGIVSSTPYEKVFRPHAISRLA